ncbi:hypothetical protein RchiOBHm_Chr3g0497081 [Rosa chinensis]|uniref:Uncharacterized protein n=1 Tax=Rosa chinensis TaxID=74649 RepID=A0A2P6RHM8_ROSCH|nr:hypothetical protein RchiOBHm_Chr3g0497081 [Rosa chinensis]
MGEWEILVEEYPQDERRESNKLLILTSCFLSFNQRMQIFWNSSFPDSICLERKPMDFYFHENRPYVLED